jgi:hypothetical protein
VRVGRSDAAPDSASQRKTSRREESASKEEFASPLLPFIIEWVFFAGSERLMVAPPLDGDPAPDCLDWVEPKSTPRRACKQRESEFKGGRQICLDFFCPEMARSPNCLPQNVVCGQRIVMSP